MTISEVLEDFPDLKAADIQACLAFDLGRPRVFFLPLSGQAAGTSNLRQNCETSAGAYPIRKLISHLYRGNSQKNPNDSWLADFEDRAALLSGILFAPALAGVARVSAWNCVVLIAKM